MVEEHANPSFPNTLSVASTPTTTLNDDEIQANIFEEPHRMGWPRLIPHPSIIGHGSWSLSQARLQAIRKILQSLSVSFRELHCDQVTIMGGEPEQTPLSVFSVWANAKTASEPWREAVLRIVALLSIKHPSQFERPISAVEIREVGYPLLAPIEAGDPCLNVWEGMLAPAVIKLMKWPRIDWESISLARFASSVSLTPGPVTLVITAFDVEDKRWEAFVLPKIRSLMEDLACGVEHVSLWQMSMLHIHEPLSNPSGQALPPFRQNLFPNSWRDEQWMLIGDGISAAGEKNRPGTVGGVVQLQAAGGKKTDCILTSFCAVLSERLVEASGPNQGSRCFAREPFPFPVKVPAALDTTTLLEGCKAGVETWQELVEIAKKRLESSSGNVLDREEATMTFMKMASNDTAQFLQSKTKVQKYQALPAGTLKATSGIDLYFEEGKHFALNWALVKIDPLRSFLRCIFNRDTSGHNVHFEGDFYLPDWASSDFNRFAAPGPKVDGVVKLGRMTGWSRGRLNHAVVLRRRTCLNTSTGYGYRDDLIDRYYQVLPEFNATGVRGSFALTGDCGSVVRNETDGCWVGMIIGAHPRGWAMMTPMDKTLKSIENITGERVVDPKPVGTPDVAGN
ncbi:hypothetical protein JOL62DRAFT_633605 [Phyllosticta paracitricarpa]|uniref:Uncharacterized protein n=1 Tax=Phyllosticta paracitricarpa TaxID=2016321 RepID=A0ABR1MRR0_9PEZI